ncbi:Tetratricopeptide repeat protein [compost metagenome]
MFQHLFAEMNKMLQEIAADFPTAEGARRNDLLCKYNMLHRLSDEVMDEWLAFAEKLSDFRQNADFSPPSEEEMPQVEAPELAMDSFVRGQCYYKLLMYRKCIEQFKQVITRYPDSLAARLYLAMAYLQEGELDVSWGHLHHMLALIREKKLKAMIYNALGCIRAFQKRYDEAQELFGLSLQHDPLLAEPNVNLEVCRRRGGKLQFGHQLVSLL